MIWLCVGHQRMGKTTQLISAVRQLYTNDRGPRPIFIHDLRGHRGEFVRRRLVAVHNCWRSPGEMMRAMSEPTLPTASLFWRCPPDDVFRFALHWQQEFQPAIVVIDELDRCPRLLTEGKHAAYDVLHYGEAQGMDVAGSLRSPWKLDPDWLAEAHRVDLFNLTGRPNLRAIRETGWPDADALADALPTLKPTYHIPLDLKGPPRS